MDTLDVGWARLTARVSWRSLQPREDGPIQWSLLQDFEAELQVLKEHGVTPMVVILDSPRWATKYPTGCSAILPEKFAKFAAFMQAMASRYGAPEFNVHHWELGNEPDVDPDLVGKDNLFGCWGDTEDPFYGGRTYGEMLKVVTPAIRAADPAAKVWVGGLLLNEPNTTTPGAGRPELFLQGILEAGAAPYFDGVPYHWYRGYTQERKDYDTVGAGKWNRLGGGVAGKARFLREMMQQYGVSKPVMLNETSFTCPNDDYSIGSFPWCANPDDAFYRMQATMLVRMFVRGVGANITGFIWYTLNGPGWRLGGLLDSNQNPKLVYMAYKVLNTQLYDTTLVGSVNYGDAIEAYAFRKGAAQMHVIWAKDDQSLPIRMPQAQYISAVDMYGNTLTPVVVGSEVQLMATLDPIYVLRQQ